MTVDAEPILKEVGARITKRYVLEKEVVGNRSAKIVIVVEYPNYEAIDKVFSSAEYAQAIPFRGKAFSEYSVHVTA